LAAWTQAFQVPGGWLGDRFGARKVLTIIVSYWSRPWENAYTI
jgi:MFS family permease